MTEPPQQTPQDNADQEETAVVWNCADVVEAAIIEDALKEAGIPAVMDSMHDRAFDGVYTFQKGWARVRVPKQHADKAVEIIKEAVETGPGDGE